MLLNASRRVRKGRPKNYIPDEDIRPLAAMFLKGEPVEGEVAVITREQAAGSRLQPQSKSVGRADRHGGPALSLGDHRRYAASR